MHGISAYLKLAVQYAQSLLMRRAVGRSVRALIVETKHGLMAVDPSDRGVGRRLLIHGDYAADERDRLTTLLTEADNVLVVGGHIGAFIVPLSKRCSTLVAVEPNPVSRQLLELNLQLNGIRNCRILPFAASDKEGTLEMLIGTANSGGSKRVPVRGSRLYNFDNPQRMNVPGRRLDDELGSWHFKLIVMDIEGSEYFALRGMQTLLAKCTTLAVEFLPHHLRDVAGIDVATFLTPIEPHFSSLFVPSRNLTVSKDGFLTVLEDMYSKDQGDDGLLFSK